MPKKWMFAVLVLSLLLSPVLAQAKVIAITNNTGSHLIELYISAASTDDWEEDLLDGEVLSPGETWRVDFAPGYTVVDLLAIYDNGAEQAYSNINLPRVSKIILNAKDATLR